MLMGCMSSVAPPSSHDANGANTFPVAPSIISLVPRPSSVPCSPLATARAFRPGCGTSSQTMAPSHPYPQRRQAAERGFVAVPHSAGSGPWLSVSASLAAFRRCVESVSKQGRAGTRSVPRRVPSSLVPCKGLNRFTKAPDTVKPLQHSSKCSPLTFPRTSAKRLNGCHRRRPAPSPTSFAPPYAGRLPADQQLRRLQSDCLEAMAAAVRRILDALSPPKAEGQDPAELLQAVLSMAADARIAVPVGRLRTRRDFEEVLPCHDGRGTGPPAMNGLAAFVTGGVWPGPDRCMSVKGFPGACVLIAGG